MTSEIKEFEVTTGTCRGHQLDGVGDPPVRKGGMGSGCDYGCLAVTWNNDTETTVAASPGDRRPAVGSPVPRARHLEMRTGLDGISPVTATVRCGAVVPMAISADSVPTAASIPGAENDLSTSKASRCRRVSSGWKAKGDATSTPTSRNRYRPASTASAAATALSVFSSFWPFWAEAPIPLKAGTRET
ncbi:UNVERIFIED_CONTAM: hypothetical protein K2H54_039231 [Gekko kuhli]